MAIDTQIDLSRSGLHPSFIFHCEQDYYNNFGFLDLNLEAALNFIRDDLENILYGE